MENHDEVRLLVPAESCHRRIVRLVAAEAGERAGFDVSELDDLRAVVDELLQALVEAADSGVLLEVVVDGGRVTVQGLCHRPPGAPSPQLPSVSELMVDAVTDHYALEEDGDATSFVVVKQGSRVSQ